MQSFALLSDNSLSVIIIGGRTLDVAFDTPHECGVWYVCHNAGGGSGGGAVFTRSRARCACCAPSPRHHCRYLGLQALLYRQRAMVEDSDIKHLRRAFLAEDTRGEGFITYDKVKLILRRLNIYKNKKLLRSMFNTVDVAGTGSLSFEAFVRMVDLMRDRPDVSAVYHNIAAAAAAAAASAASSTATTPATTPAARARDAAPRAEASVSATGPRRHARSSLTAGEMGSVGSPVLSAAARAPRFSASSVTSPAIASVLFGANAEAAAALPSGEGAVSGGLEPSFALLSPPAAPAAAATAAPPTGGSTLMTPEAFLHFLHKEQKE
ncbi:hypothetical protein EON68_04530, partial [archaeon]